MDLRDSPKDLKLVEIIVGVIASLLVVLAIIVLVLFIVRKMMMRVRRKADFTASIAGVHNPVYLGQCHLISLVRRGTYVYCISQSRFSTYKTLRIFSISTSIVL